MEPINRPVRNAYTVSVDLASVSDNKKVKFPDIPQLRGKRITAIEAFSESDLTKDDSGATLASTTGLAGCVLTMANEESDETIFQVPVLSFRRGSNNGRLYQLAGEKFDYESSSVKMTDTTNLSNNEVIVFAFYYD